jgi:hypothetical protein
MSATDVEVSRALNALVTTLNDQRPVEPDEARWQAIVTGALGGGRSIVVRRERDGGALHDAHDGRVLGRFRREGDRWISERAGAPLSGGYIPR